MNTLQQLLALIRRRRSVADFHLWHVVFEGMKVEECIPGPRSLQAKCNRKTVYEELLEHLLCSKADAHPVHPPVQVDFVRCKFGPFVSLTSLAREHIMVSFIHCQTLNTSCDWPLQLVRAPALGAASLFTEPTSA